MNEDLDITLADLTITKNAENCILRVYPDPASPLAVALQARNLWSTVLAGGAIPPELTDRSGAPWTGGWGHTGPDVIQGMIVTQEIADAWL